MSVFEINAELEGYPAFKRSNDRTEIFEHMHESQNWLTVEHDGWHMPAIDEPKEDCGKWLAKGCLDHTKHHGEFKGKVFIKTFQKSCYRASCQICYRKWMARESNKATRRIEKYEELSKRKVKHIIVSPPAWLHNKPKKELAKLAYKVLKDVKAIGGSVIFHPFRYHKDNKTWYYSPHFHVMGFGWISNTKEIYNKNGWLVKNKGTRDSTFATFYYMLSHAGIKKRNHSLIWFGDLSYSKLKVEEDPETNKCPACNSDLHLVFHYGLFGYMPPPETLVELWTDPDGWYIVDSQNSIPMIKSRNTRSGNYENDGQGIGTDYSRWADKKESVNIPKFFVSSSLCGNERKTRNDDSEVREDSSSYVTEKKSTVMFDE